VGFHNLEKFELWIVKANCRPDYLIAVTWPLFFITTIKKNLERVDRIALAIEGTSRCTCQKFDSQEKNSPQTTLRFLGFSLFGGKYFLTALRIHGRLCGVHEDL
jgi:hypothetical protein